MQNQSSSSQSVSASAPAATASSNSAAATPTPTPTSTNNNTTTTTISTTTTASNAVHIPHAVQEINGKQITVVWIDDRRWMIGVQVAALLERETYNLYRSMKVKNIEVRRATVEQIEYLLKHEIVRSGTRSITFVSLDQSIGFLADELKKLDKKRQKAAMIINSQMKSDSARQASMNFMRSQDHYALGSAMPPGIMVGGPHQMAAISNAYPMPQIKNEDNTCPPLFGGAASVSGGAPGSFFSSGSVPPAPGSFSLQTDFPSFAPFTAYPLFYSFDRGTCSPSALHPSYASQMQEPVMYHLYSHQSQQ